MPQQHPFMTFGGKIKGTHNGRTLFFSTLSGVLEALESGEATTLGLEKKALQILKIDLV